MSSAGFSILVNFPGHRGRAVAPGGRGAGRAGHTEIWIFRTIWGVHKIWMWGLILKTACVLQLSILKLQLRTQGSQWCKWRISSFSAGLGNHSSKTFHNIWLKKEKKTPHRLDVILKGIFLGLEEQRKMEKMNRIFKHPSLTYFYFFTSEYSIFSFPSLHTAKQLFCPQREAGTG